MKQLYVWVLLLLAIQVAGQDLSTMSLKKTFKSEEELIKTYPSLVKHKLVLEKSSIKLLDRDNTIKNQVSRSSIPSNLNTFIFSPTNDYFVAYEETEVETGDLYFYRKDGVLLSKQRISIYPNVKFSTNGEYIIAFNSFGREIFIFNKNGTMVFSGDYINLINDKSRVLDNVLVSDDGKEIMINAGDDIYSFDIKTRNLNFKTAVGGWVLDGNSYSSTGKIAFKIKRHNQENGSFDFKVISKKSGQILDNIPDLRKIEFVPSAVILSKNSNVLEYVFKK